jgi:hypothetical protein
MKVKGRVNIGRSQCYVALMAVIVGFLVSACATQHLATREDNILAKQFNPPADKSYIYVIRESTITGAAIFMSISLDQEVAGALQNNRYVLLEATPGRHEIQVGSSRRGEKKNVEFIAPTVIELETLPGRAYFIAGNMTMGRPDIRIVADEKGRKLLGKDKFKRVESLL